ncbi:GAF domain-containing protein [Zunongwangia sp.]|uniref:GAF domain-containing protein n=1 Tax=Zunongwangia sp. TaxID=1965325 RepID=UPI003AA89A1A
MNENERLKELRKLEILDTIPEKEFDELAEIASYICQTPISLISLVDKNRQWFKSKVGLEVAQTDRKDSFCQHSFHNPEEVLVIKDSLKDERFINNNLVTGDPHIRFYAGAPLETPSGNILGTLCVIDRKPREINEDQKKALKLLAKKAMNLILSRQKISNQDLKIKKDGIKLKRIIDLAPGVIFKYRHSYNKDSYFDIMSKGISKMHPDLTPKIVKQNPMTILEYIHPEDREKFILSIQYSLRKISEWKFLFRIIDENQKIQWYRGEAHPELAQDKTILCYGTFQNVSSEIEYESVLEEIAFDISHVLRRPVTSLLGLTSLINEDTEITTQKLQEYINHIQIVSEELDVFTRKLNDTYHLKRKNNTNFDKDSI